MTAPDAQATVAAVVLRVLDEDHACLMRLPFGDWLRLRWWRFLDHFHRCPECGHWPDAHRDKIAPRWEDDKTAQMLGIARYGCRRCGHDATVTAALDTGLREQLARAHMAQAWDEGWSTALEARHLWAAEVDFRPDNPYRAALADKATE